MLFTRFVSSTTPFKLISIIFRQFSVQIFKSKLTKPKHKFRLKPALELKNQIKFTLDPSSTIKTV